MGTERHRSGTARAREWDYGVYLRGVVNSSVDSSALQDNLFGAVLYRNATGNTVRGCNVTGNGYGLVLSDGAAGCVVSENRIVGNECGLGLDDSDGVTVSRNVIAASTDSGIHSRSPGAARSTTTASLTPSTWPSPASPSRRTPGRSRPAAARTSWAAHWIGGNFWGRPDGAGFSEVTADRDGDGFSDAPLTVAPQNVDDHPLAPSVGFVPTPEATPTFEPPTIETTPPTPFLPTPTATPSPNVTETPIPSSRGDRESRRSRRRREVEDVNGNGRPDFADVVLLFERMTWIAENAPVAAFDYNNNGRIDFADVIALFWKL